MSDILTDWANKAEVELLARQMVAAALAAALRDPRALAGRAGESGKASEAVLAAWECVGAAHAGAVASDLGLGEIPPARADARPLARWLVLPPAERERAWAMVFGLVVSRECPPYETEYCASKDATHRAHHMADIAGFFYAFGVEPDAAHPERVDHVALGLAFVALLLEKRALLAGADGYGPLELAREEICRDALTAFVRDHVVWWVPTFARAVERRVERLVGGEADTPIRGPLDTLAGVCRLMRAWVGAERLWAGLEPTRRVVEPSVSMEGVLDQTCEGVCGGCQPPGE